VVGGESGAVGGEADVPGEVDGDRVDGAFDEDRPAAAGGDEVGLLGGAEQVLALPVQGGGRGVHPLRASGVGVGQPASGGPDHSPTVDPALDEGDDEPVPHGVDHPAVPAGDGGAGVDELPVGEPRPAGAARDTSKTTPSASAARRSTGDGASCCTTSTTLPRRGVPRAGPHRLNARRSRLAIVH